MNLHVMTDWSTPKPYLRRGHIAALIAMLVFRVHLTLALRRERHDIRRLQAASKDLPEHIKRDIGLL